MRADKATIVYIGKNALPIKSASMKIEHTKRYTKETGKRTIHIKTKASLTRAN